MAPVRKRYVHCVLLMANKPLDNAYPNGPGAVGLAAKQ